MRTTASSRPAALLVLVTAFAGLTLLAACAPPQAANPRSAAYSPLFEGAGTEDEPRGSMAGDFSWACEAETVAEAAARWEAFLAQHGGDDAEYEDGFHWRRVEAAQFELVRVYYLLGRTDEADARLRALSGMM